VKIKEELLNKNGLAVMKMANELSGFRPGDRFPRVSLLAERNNLSVGTTQYALTYLKEKRVVFLVSRGHLGTFVKAVDYERLREYAGTADKACVMPLPYSLRYEGLASAFSTLGNRRDKFYVSFMNGSGRRVQALLKGRYDCALLSKAAADAFIQEGFPLEIALSYGPGSFLEAHVLVYRTKGIQDIRTLGLDPESRDQVILSKQFVEKRPNIKLVSISYARIINHLHSGNVDASFWNMDYFKEHHSFLRYEPLNVSADREGMSEAVLVVRLGDAATADYIIRRFPQEKVLESQREILSGERIPEY
jgi:hypothetical protein